MSYIIILMVQHNYFQIRNFSSKILNPSAKSFFPRRNLKHDKQCCKSFNILAISFYNCFDSLKLSLDLYLAKFLDISAKPFFPWSGLY